MNTGKQGQEKLRIRTLLTQCSTPLRSLTVSNIL